MSSHTSGSHTPERAPWPVILGRVLRLTAQTAVGTLPLGVLSLALALVIWVTVTRAENPSVRRLIPVEIPVEQVNVPRSLLSTNLQPAKVTVTISGPRTAVNDIRPEDVTARVDLSRVDEEVAGAREALVERPLRVEVRRRGVRAEVVPESVRVTLERQERRTVPVCVSRVDVTPPGFMVDDPIPTDPPEVTLVGPRRNLDSVECAAASLRLTGLTVSVAQQVPLEARDSAGRAIGGVTLQPATATLNVKVRQNLFSRQVAVDARFTGRPAPGYTVASVRTDPLVANLVGPLDVVNALTSVPTDEVDIEGARMDVVRSVSMQLPAGVSSGERRAVVTIQIQAVRSPGSVGVAPRIVNLGPNLTATLGTPSVAVLVSGPLAEMLALRPTDISVTVDTAALAPGTYRLEPKAQLPPGISLDGIVPDRVDVTIAPSR